MDKGFEVGVGVVKINTGVLVIVGGMTIGGRSPLVDPGFGKHGLHEVVSDVEPVGPLVVGPLVVGAIVVGGLLEDMLPSIINYKADIALIVVKVEEVS